MAAGVVVVMGIVVVAVVVVTQHTLLILHTFGSPRKTMGIYLLISINHRLEEERQTYPITSTLSLL
jgi:hypothetical protein